MKEVPITAIRRDSVGKGFARRERMAGNIPAVVYGPEVEPVPISVDERAFRTAMKAAGGASTLISLDVEGAKNTVVLREIQRDPVTSKITHLDFHAISMTRPMYLSIPISFVGTPRGVKTDGGIMQITMREMEVSCLPTDIPDKIELDVTDLGIGDSIHVKDVSIPKANILDSERRTVVVIAAPTVVKADAVEEAEEAEVVEGEEGAEAAEGATEAETAEGKEPPKKDDGKKK
ncbi:MAG: 50S ribosomal protein L25 [candidate division Zixibacteria bacterium]|nr:50S ribosomal protein L25 [candidate division Zixibacteria bacterium]